MGEQKQRRQVLKSGMPEMMAVDTMSGRIQMHWDQTLRARPNGQSLFLRSFYKLRNLTKHGCNFVRWSIRVPMR